MLCYINSTSTNTKNEFLKNAKKKLYLHNKSEYKQDETYKHLLN